MPDRRRFIATGLSTLIISTLCLPVHAASLAATEGSSSEDPVRAGAGRILVVGDSLSAEYGLPQGSGWVVLTAQRLRDHNTGYEIHNSSISGDTTSGGLTRLPAELERVDPDIVIIELGSNDALRGLSLDMVQENLGKMITLSQNAGAHVVLIGMQIPPNYGRQYTDRFANLFADLARQHQATLVPFLMEGFATQPDMFLDDGIHPNEAAQGVIADTVWQHLAPLVGK